MQTMSEPRVQSEEDDGGVVSKNECLWLVFIRHGEPLEANMFEDDEGHGTEGAGPLKDEDEFYPESSQWEAEEEEDEEKGPKPPPPPTAVAAAAITEKVTSFISA